MQMLSYFLVWTVFPAHSPHATRLGQVCMMSMGNTQWNFSLMTKRTYIGWIRDRDGKVVSRPEKTDVSNAITQATGGAHTCQEDGLGNTTPYVVYEFE